MLSFHLMFSASIEKHVRYPGGTSFMKEVICNAVSSFLYSSMDECWCFHPLVWIDLIENGPSKKVFSSIDISTQDPFAIDVCYAVSRISCTSCRLRICHDGRGPLKQYSHTIPCSNQHYLFTDTVNYFLERLPCLYVRQMFPLFLHP